MSSSTNKNFPPVPRPTPGIPTTKARQGEPTKPERGDDPAAIRELEEAEARARQSIILADDAKREAAELAAQLTLERAERLREYELRRAEPATPRRVDSSERPKSPGITLHWKGWKIAVPVASLATVIPILISVGSNVASYVTRFKAMEQYIANDQKVHEAMQGQINACITTTNDLIAVASGQASFITKAFPYAGVQVPSGEGGSPLVLETKGKVEKPKRLVTLTTPVPTPVPAR